MSGARPQPVLLYLVTEDWYFVSHRLPLARAAVREGYRVVVATRVNRHEREIRETGAEVEPIRLRRGGMSLVGDLAGLVQLVGLYRRVRPDLAHHVALKPVVFGSMAARAAGVPHVVNALAGLGYVFTADTRRARAARWVVEQAYRRLLAPPGGMVLLQNPDDRALLVDRGIVPRDRTTLIRGSGVDLDQFVPAPEPSGDPVVVLPARMLWDKGIGEFVEAARLLRSRGVPIRMVLLGGEDPANPHAIPRTQLAAWQQEAAVDWWGHRNDMPAALAQATIVCLPSYREGLPKALLEAGAVGRALISTDVPGCREVVRHEENGLLVPPRDPVKLAEAIETLVRDAPLRHRMAARSRAIVEAEFAVERVIRQNLELYRSLLS